MGVSHCKNCSYRDLLHFLHHRHTTIARLVEGFSRRTANNRSPPTFESRESHFVSRSIHAFHVLGGAVGAALYARYSSDLFVPRAGSLICGVDLSQSQRCASGQLQFVAQCRWYVPGASETSPLPQTHPSSSNNNSSSSSSSQSPSNPSYVPARPHRNGRTRLHHHRCQTARGVLCHEA